MPAYRRVYFSFTYTYVSLMTLNLRPAKVRQLVAYMATAACAEAGTPYADCDAGTTLSRWATEFQNGYNGVNHDHPYTEMWLDIQRWYKSEVLQPLRCRVLIVHRQLWLLALPPRVVPRCQLRLWLKLSKPGPEWLVPV